MNYKVINEKFIILKEDNGLIENNTAGTIEIAVTDSVPIKNNEENVLIEPHGKFYFTKDGSKKVYVRLTNRISGLINVFETKSESGGGGSQLDNYYNKSEADEKFVKKEGNAGTSTKLETTRTIKLTGAITGQASFDGSADANITTTLENIDGEKINALTGYVKGENFNAISPTDSLLVAIGKLEKGIEEAKAPSVLSRTKASNSNGKDFKFYYCTESEYNSMKKIQDDSTIYLVLDEKSGIVIMRCYRP